MDNLDEQRHLIIANGKNKTKYIESCIYNSKTRKYDITFIDGKTYHYLYENVEWVKNPEALNPELYRIRKKWQAT